MIFGAVIMVSTCVFQSAGKAGVAFWLAISRQGIVFCAILICASKLWGYLGIIGTQPLSDLVTAIIALILFQKNIRREM